ncbi:uncharacterized protein B0P05DRAFT_561887 [Gilbertella persicaria]|uniref:uncharacterized protein n=1 Tax=Gilbertella persicaria TaxID=101096 RepID=UPI00221EA613|nr:uncharacterized protein B0P05DRAFT_561887 [Gilbertella persicaria]KAI8053177.1 hypothetical protein B0P05DRAFT_561887 [Gilbertella persicaria]
MSLFFRVGFFISAFILSFALTAKPPLVSLTITILGFPEPKFYSLTCDPTGGNHTKADSACDIIDDSKGNITYIDSYPIPYSKDSTPPINITIEGHYHDTLVSYRHEYPNQITAINNLRGIYPEEES